MLKKPSKPKPDDDGYEEDENDEDIWEDLEDWDRTF